MVIKTELQGNNLDLRAILDMANNLPNQAVGGEDITEEVSAQESLIDQIQVALNGKAASNIFAVISVTYPEGSTCTCSDGDKTFTDKDTSGQVIFPVPYAGSWTVSCTDGINSKEQTVEIISEGQSENVKLSYKFYLFKSGEGAKVELSTSVEDSQCYATVGTDKISLGWQSNNRTTAVSTANKIDLSEYNTLNIEYTCSDVGSTNYNESFGVSNNKFSTGTTASNLTISKQVMTATSTRTINILDISDVNGEYYVGVCGAGKSEIYNFWLE